MKFVLNESYKSLTPFETELPEFVVLTGLNGSGKTQFLEGIKNGIIIPSPEIAHHTINYIDLNYMIPYEKEYLGFSIDRSSKSLAERYEHFQQVRESNENVHLEDLFDDANTRLIFEKIARTVNKNIYDLSKDDVFTHYPLVDDLKADIFSHNFTGIFRKYIERLDENRYRQYRNEKFGSNFRCFSEENFFLIYGQPPWIFVNKILKEANLDFMVTHPSLEDDRNTSFRVKFIDKLSGLEVNIKEISSGEKVIMAMALAFFNSKHDVKFPKLLLMDEPDASLHPLMTKQFLDIIVNVFLKEEGVNVVISTHSPSTVALAPEESLFVMSKTGERINKTTKDQALKVLTAGVSSLSVNYEHRRQVFVESEIDAFIYDKIYEKLKHKLISEISLSFIPSGNDKNGGCTHVKQIVNQLTKFGNKYVFGIVDWDCKNNGNEHIRVLGKGKRYSIENYIFDPILVAAYLLREKFIERRDLGLLHENYTDFKNFSASQFQIISDYIVGRIHPLAGFVENTKISIKYLNKFEIEIPQWYLMYQGHKLEDVLKQAFRPLYKFKKEPELKKEIVNKVIDDFPELIPLDFFDLFMQLQAD